MPMPAALGAVIRSRRLELGWTQEELAERISRDGEYIRQSEVSRIENGKVALPRRERLERIAATIDMPIGELLALSGWAGAESQFQPSTSDGLPPEAGSVEPGDLTASTTEVDAIHAFQQVLTAMREESDRPQRERQIIDHIEQLLQRFNVQYSAATNPEPGTADD